MPATSFSPDDSAVAGKAVEESRLERGADEERHAAGGRFDGAGGDAAVRQRGAFGAPFHKVDGTLGPVSRYEGAVEHVAVAQGGGLAGEGDEEGSKQQTTH